MNVVVMPRSFLTLALFRRQPKYPDFVPVFGENAMRCFVFPAMVSILFLSLSPQVQADDIAKAVETRRGKTALSKMAAEMKPGTWSELKVEMPKGLWMSPRVNDRGGLHIAGWTDDAHWDSRTGQFLYMGVRQTRQFIAYSEEKNAWRVIPLDRESDNPVFETKFGHIYGNNAFDPVTSRFFHRYHTFDEKQGGISSFDVVTEKWTKLPPAPATTTEAGYGMSIEYFGARKTLVILGPRLRHFSDAAQQWSMPTEKSPIDGYHGLFRHNPFRNEVLLAGGNNSPKTVARLKKDGTIERLKDFPRELGVRSDKVTIDPQSGRYLILHRDREFYEFDSDTNECRLFDDFSKTAWPFHNFDMPVVAFIPEYGVTMWAASSKCWLYKHDAGR